MLTGWRMMMEDAHTPASYIIAVVAVLSGAFLMPPFPLFFLIVGPVCLLGLVAVLFVRAKRSVQTEHKSHGLSHEMPVTPTHTVMKTTSEVSTSQQSTREKVSA
ncbi:MAG: hypothetical protein M3Z24_11870 [Chloroflexota bacterium]|nr:hypothetical protein [Chloroflexota bacterium]